MLLLDAATKTVGGGVTHGDVKAVVGRSDHISIQEAVAAGVLEHGLEACFAGADQLGATTSCSEALLRRLPVFDPLAVIAFNAYRSKLFVDFKAGFVVGLSSELGGDWLSILLLGPLSSHLVGMGTALSEFAAGALVAKVAASHVDECVNHSDGDGNGDCADGNGRKKKAFFHPN